MLAKIKGLLAQLLALLAVIAFGWFKLKNKAAEQIRNETAQQAADLARQVNQAAAEGLANEARIREKYKTNTGRADLD